MSSSSYSLGPASRRRVSTGGRRGGKARRAAATLALLRGLQRLRLQRARRVSGGDEATGADSALPSVRATTRLAAILANHGASAARLSAQPERAERTRSGGLHALGGDRAVDLAQRASARSTTGAPRPLGVGSKKAPTGAARRAGGVEWMKRVITSPQPPSIT